ncbi:MAG: adenylate/guanylate cyclase domain-containing protein, partial [Candidatus Binatia bacterium]
RLQTDFGRFAPTAVVDRIAARGPVDAERREVTVLFADLVAFTALSETLSPEVLVGVLNGYFDRVTQAISAHRGHVSKFIGDGLMALFGALEPNPWQANDAVHAALAARQVLQSYNAELAARALPALQVGIGIHRGDAIAGLVGNQSLMEFTVIGPTVNLASRVEALTRTYQVDILITEAVRAALDPRFQVEARPPANLRGVAEPVRTWAVLGFDDRPTVT